MRKGFTLVELVIVIVILGILAAVAMPKFFDIVGEAKKSATKAGLGSIRSVIALKYSESIATGVPTYPTAIVDADFFDGKLPKNSLSGNSAAVTVAAVVTDGTATSASGWWFVATGDDSGRAGAYSDGTVDTSTW